jgi:hypothetical protein
MAQLPSKTQRNHVVCLFNVSLLSRAGRNAIRFLQSVKDTTDGKQQPSDTLKDFQSGRRCVSDGKEKLVFDGMAALIPRLPPCGAYVLLMRHNFKQKA